MCFMKFVNSYIDKEERELIIKKVKYCLNRKLPLILKVMKENENIYLMVASDKYGDAHSLICMNDAHSILCHTLDGMETFLIRLDEVLKNNEIFSNTIEVRFIDSHSLVIKTDKQEHICFPAVI